MLRVLILALAALALANPARADINIGVTLSATGRLGALDWPEPGLRLNFT